MKNSRTTIRQTQRSSPRRSDHGVQLTMFGIRPSEFTVNVASVPMRSPFRYPGGKTWLVPHVRNWLKSIRSTPSILVEPFAGGAIVGLTAAFEHLASHVVLVELDEDVAAVWQTILSPDAEWLIGRMLDFQVSLDQVRETLAQTKGGVRERAFRTILKNRMQHGGIMAPGASLIKHGENGKGLNSRWYVGTLVERIRAISKIRDRFTFVQGDGIEVIRHYRKRKRATFFIDPPYTAGARGKRAGTRLYRHNEVNHEALFDAAESVAGDFLMTYDDDAHVRFLATKHSFEIESVAMKNTHHAKMTELLIGRNLNWVH